MAAKSKNLSYTVILDPDDQGRGYTVTVPALPGIVTEGRNFEEAMAMAKDAIEGHLASLAELGEPIPIERGEPVIGRISVRLKVA
jgi:predicted RNase H-like HicB family nuclease